ncbi:MAG: DUF1294 domain-containing protein [Patescibacteria group bacterium]
MVLIDANAKFYFSMNIQIILLAIFLAINLATFLVMLWDKSRSRVAGAERISEGMLFFMAVMFGSIGVYLGMLAFRHKTRKWYFIVGIPVVILQNIATLYVISLFLA